MQHDYGFIEGHIGSDDDEVDCYIGPVESSPDVHIVHQLRAPDFKVHDEDKVMLGFSNADAAKRAYLAHRNDGERAFGGMSTVPLERFKAKLERRTGTGKIRASAGPVPDRTFEAIMALADKQVTALRAKGKATRDYPEELTKRALALGAAVLAKDLRGLKGDITAATSYEDLQKRLVARYRDKMNPDDLGRLVQRTRIMANLAGRLAIAQEAQ